jgi:3-hydroxyisobutyrate dehydrogenase-like beta-hydroxyacid dehydrogenase
MISRHSVSPNRKAQGKRQSTTKDHRPKTKGQRPELKIEGGTAVIGMIGLGIMGSAMAGNIVRAGYTVVGYDVDAARLRDHVRAGGIAARNSSEVRKRADVVVCSLPSAAALAQVATELAESEGADVVVETSTLPIAVKLEARQRLADAGVTLLDCPLSGTGSQARVKDIVVYVSGPEDGYRRVSPVMDGFARAHYYVGAFGAGSKTKFVANLLVAIHNVAAAEALVLSMKAGLDPEVTLKVIADGAGNSRMLQVRGPMMVQGDYGNPTMKLDVWQKDMTVIADFAREVGCPTPMFSTTAPFYLAAMAAGRGAEDTGAVCAVLEEMAGVERPAASRRGRRRLRSKS